MSLFYRLLADLTVIAHFVYVMFVILGLVATLAGWLFGWRWVRNRWFRGVHLAMILIVVVESWVGITCPLTTWEHELRTWSGQETYQGDFIANWVHDALFVDAERWMFTLCYSLFGGLVLLSLFLVPPDWRISGRRAGRRDQLPQPTRTQRGRGFLRVRRMDAET